MSSKLPFVPFLFFQFQKVLQKDLQKFHEGKNQGEGKKTLVIQWRKVHLHPLVTLISEIMSTKKNTKNFFLHKRKEREMKNDSCSKWFRFFSLGCCCWRILKLIQNCEDEHKKPSKKNKNEKKCCCNTSKSGFSVIFCSFGSFFTGGRKRRRGSGTGDFRILDSTRVAHNPIITNEECSNFSILFRVVKIQKREKKTGKNEIYSQT